MRLNAKENGWINPTNTVRATPILGGRLYLAAILREGRKYRSICSSLGISRGFSDQALDCWTAGTFDGGWGRK